MPIHQRTSMRNVLFALWALAFPVCITLACYLDSLASGTKTPSMLWGAGDSVFIVVWAGVAWLLYERAPRVAAIATSNVETS